MSKPIETRHMFGYRHFNLLRELIVRDIKIRYRRSVLGILWTLAFPLASMLVMTVIFSTLFKNSIEYFPVYFLTGSVLFTFHSEATSSAMTAITGNGALLRKVYVPKFLFPLARIGAALINMIFALLALLIVMIMTGVPFHATILLFPIPLFYLLLFTTGLSYIVAALTVFFRDIQHIYSVLLMLWLYLTPLFYPKSIVPENMLWIYDWNPLVYMIDMFRQLVMYGTLPDLQTHLISFSVGVVTLLIGAIIFRRTQDRFIFYV